MKNLISIIFFTSIATSVFATHNHSGYISYRHLNGLTYQATIVTYTRSCSLCADRCELNLNWGDGSSSVLKRINGDTLRCTDATDGVVIDSVNEIRKNVYRGSHTYSSAGIYTLFMEDANRTSSINNIVNSQQVPFYIKSDLLITPGGLNNNSPDFPQPPVFLAQLQKEVRYSFATNNSEGDYLKYELVNVSGGDGVEIASTYDSQFVGSMPTIDELTGEFRWTPQNTGAYNFAVKVSECRNNQTIGSVIFDFLLNVQPSGNLNPGFKLNWQQDAQNRYVYTIAPGDTLDLELAFGNSFADSLILETYGEAYLATTQAANFSQVNLGSDSIAGNLTWVPNSSFSRCAPYLFALRGGAFKAGQFSNLDATLAVYVQSNSLTGCDSICNSISINQDMVVKPEVEIVPNPFSSTTIINLKDFDANETFELTLYTLNGKKIKSIKNIAGNLYELQRGSLKSGIYFYVLHCNKSEASFTGKLVVGN